MPQAFYIRQSTGILLANSEQQTCTPPKTNHDAHLCPLLRWCLQVNRRRVVTPNSVILEKRNLSTILSLADALPFQMAAFSYTAATQTVEMGLNNTRTNLPAKMAMAMVVPAAAAAEMVVVRSRRRVKMGRQTQFLQQMTPPIHRQMEDDSPLLSPPPPQRIIWRRCWTTRG